MTLIRSLTAASVLALACMGSAGPALAADVTWDDILNDHQTTDDVLMYGMGNNAQRYSTLNQINAETVKHLRPAWAFSFGDEKQRGQEAQAIVHDGVIYITGSYSRIWALDAKTGKRLWKFEARLAEDIRPCCDVVNRGAAIYGDKVFFGALDASIYALDKNTGKVVWREKFGDHKVGYTMTGAPTIVKDKETDRVMLIHGSSGDEFGVVGKLYARDPDTGAEIWMRPFVEGHMGAKDGKDSTVTGDPAAPSWPNNADGSKVEAWSHGGGAPWQSASFDVETNTIIVGAGNPAPWNTWARTPGDSLYTSGQAYVDPSNGELIGFYQHTPNDAWDFSGNNEIVLFDFTDKDGKQHRAGAHADRNGFFYVTDVDALSKRGGEINRPTALLNAFPFVDGITWAKGIDLETGRPIENEGQRPPLPKEGETKGETIQVTPPFLGGKNWNPMAYSQKTGLFYVPANNWTEDYWTENVTYQAGAAYLGQGFRIKRLFDDHIGTLRAYDPATGEKKWEHKEEFPLWAGVLATAGDVVFTGTSDGFVKAFHSETGEVLWEFQTGSGIISQPVTWELDGKQYLGIASGYGGAVPLWGGDMATLTTQVSQGGSFWVFEIPDELLASAQ
ncbi:PQQ-dependent methanol/ethanol family dehydrogenase (plasmid) [Gemmobacter fulvus]|uniref:PQQ-dependent methanol/ethanol family dehydrogenase n=1 Tax=Gemmobacter fulvus TaxID=2840474 RepID=A0A975PB81_9RHOB|nr:PQQ-dependent methanol/ethanol family dehydrogenase [Gemmobacter fulvus]MBT9246013.1 PQQ-dependent methanol/ethanol family dehydrogenase [Gemmobacter fulvus]MDQ1850395.1 PQQ-dependent methanol/ethanol family dehydrogenase [Gemmobacter fulvus]QWK92221.1 PQQ-dependent methanol/ethanol family dehydrogenase [Gemmobacter fulvus]